mgnify:CR=1 FL=1
MVRKPIEILKFDDFLKRLKDKNPIDNSACENSPAERRGNGVTGRRTEPGKHAHTFRMTLVSNLRQTPSNKGKCS